MNLFKLDLKTAGQAYTRNVTIQSLFTKEARYPLNLVEFDKYLKEVEYGNESLQFLLIAKYLLLDKETLMQQHKDMFYILGSLREIDTLIDMNILNTFQGKSGKDQGMLPTQPKIVRSASSLNLLPQKSEFPETEKTTKNNLDTLNWIADRFIKPDSPYELNIRDENRKMFLKLCSQTEGSPDLSILSKIEAHVFELLKINSLPRFLVWVNGNIGAAEVQQRVREFYLTAMTTIAIIVFSFTLPPARFPRGLRWIIVIPATLCIVLVLQVKMSFCVIYGLLGKVRRQGWAFYGFIKGIGGGETEVVEDVCVRHSQVVRSLTVIGVAQIISLLLGGILYSIPYNI